MSTLYLIIGIVTGAAGLLMLFAAMSDSPIRKARDRMLREKQAELHQGSRTDIYQ